MNLKIAFYLISFVLAFFLGYSYHQSNIEAPEPVFIRVDNSDEIEQYKTDLSNLKMQLDDLDAQLVNSLDNLKKSNKKLILSSSKVQVLEDEKNIIQQKYDELESKLILSDSTITAGEQEIKLLREKLENTLIELELSQFEFELLKEQL